MDPSEKLNPSSSYSIHDTTMAEAEDENFEVVASKRLKLSPSADNLTSEGGSDDDVVETGNINVVLLSPNSSLSPKEKAISNDHNYCTRSLESKAILRSTMDSWDKLNPSSLYSIRAPTMAENKNFEVAAAKRLKLSPFADNLTSEESDEDVVATGNMNVVLLSPNSSLSPEEKALSIDHILESIFMRCDRQTLLNCRLVSHRWAYYGSKELQKIVSITFYDCFRTNLFERFASVSGGAGGSMEDLITLMNNSTEFPSTSFEFRRDEICQGKSSSVNMEEAQAFFNAHGASIKKIAFHKGLSMEDLKRLLLNQAPNLLQMYLGSIDIATSSTERPSISETEEQMTQRERRQESLFDETTSKPKPVLKNLKIFKCDLFLELPLIFIEQILKCSPNLVHVALPCEYPHVLVQPTSLVHLPQVLNVYINNENIWSYELFANHLQDTNEKLAVRELHFRGTYCWNAYGEIDDDNFKEFYDIVANILMRILKACSATCQQIIWDQGVHNLKYHKCLK